MNTKEEELKQALEEEAKQSLKETCLTPEYLQLFKETETPESLREWADALKSGDYKQGIGTLQTIEGDQISYCCLGVKGLLQGVEYSHYRRKVLSDQEDSYLDFYKAAGTEGDQVGYIPESYLHLKIQGSLSLANDCGLPFEGIAEVLEAVAEALENLGGVS